MTNLGAAPQPPGGQPLTGQPSGGQFGFAPTAAAQGVAAPAEHVIARFRRHGRLLFWPSVLLIVVTGLVSFFAGRMPEAWENIAVLTAGALLIIVGFLLPLLAWLSRRYTITTRRIIVRHGFFVHERHELMHSRGYDVSVRRTWLQSAFRTGDVLINTGLERPIVLHDVPNADLVQATLHDLMEANQHLNAARNSAEQTAPPEDHTVILGKR